MSQSLFASAFAWPSHFDRLFILPDKAWLYLANKDVWFIVPVCCLLPSSTWAWITAWMASCVFWFPGNLELNLCNVQLTISWSLKQTYSNLILLKLSTLQNFLNLDFLFTYKIKFAFYNHLYANFTLNNKHINVRTVSKDLLLENSNLYG